MTISLINKGDLISHINESKRKLGLRHPILLFKIASDEIDAGAFFFGIRINTAVLEKLDINEQFAVIDHELGHIVRWKDGLFILFYISFPIPIVINGLYLILLSILFHRLPQVDWFYTRFSIILFFIFLILRFLKLGHLIKLKINSEFKADETSAKLKNATALVSALKKMESIKGQTSPKIKIHINRFYFANRPTHPSTDERIKKLEEYISNNII